MKKIDNLKVCDKYVREGGCSQSRREWQAVHKPRPGSTQPVTDRRCCVNTQPNPTSRGCQLPADGAVTTRFGHWLASLPLWSGVVFPAISSGEFPCTQIFVWAQPQDAPFPSFTPVSPRLTLSGSRCILASSCLQVAGSPCTPTLRIPPAELGEVGKHRGGPSWKGLCDEGICLRIQQQQRSHCVCSHFIYFAESLSVAPTMASPRVTNDALGAQAAGAGGRPWP